MKETETLSGKFLIYDQLHQQSCQKITPLMCPLPMLYKPVTTLEIEEQINTFHSLNNSHSHHFQSISQ